MRYGLDLHKGNPHEDRTAFPAQSSVLDEEALLHRHVRDYSVPEAQTCRFLSRGDADIYRVTTAGPCFYLKVYRPPHARAYAEAEAQFVSDLAERGVSVVSPVPHKGGGFASEALASEGFRPMLLFEEAPASSLPGIDDSVCREFGDAIAQLHEAADELEDSYGLPAADAASVLQDTLPYAKQFYAEEDYAYMGALAARVRMRLSDLQRERPSYGLCHGDLVLSNVRLDAERGTTFLDFGSARYMWRSYELAVVHQSLRSRAGEGIAQPWEALLAGYSAVRHPPADLFDSLPVMLVLRRLSWIAGNAATLPLRRGTEPFDEEIFKKALASIRETATEHSI